MSEKRKAPLFQRLEGMADNMRLLRAGLRSHDPMTVDAAYQRISQSFGELLAEDLVHHTITGLMTTEHWSWYNEKTGEPSPLLNNSLPNDTPKP